jgi:hypothetical protein
MLYVFCWVIPRHLNFICRRFGTLCLFHLHRQKGVEWLCLRNVGVFIEKKRLGSKMTWASNYPEESIQPSEHKKVWNQESWIRVYTVCPLNIDTIFFCKHISKIMNGFDCYIVFVSTSTRSPLLHQQLSFYRHRSKHVRSMYWKLRRTATSCDQILL